MNVRHKEIADRVGLSLGDVQRFPDSVSVALADRLQISQGDVERFISGEWPSVNPSVDCAKRLGLGQSAAKDLSDNLTKEGRVGFLVGLLFSRK